MSIYDQYRNEDVCPTCPKEKSCDTKKCGFKPGPAIPVCFVATLAEASQYCNAFVVVEELGNAVVYNNANGAPVTIYKPDQYLDNHAPLAGAFTNTEVHDMINKVTYVYGPAGNFFTKQGV